MGQSRNNISLFATLPLVTATLVLGQYARKGDTIVFWRLDRLGRNMQDLIQIVNSLNERGIGFHSL
ncbi:hypothetical protein COE50_06250 [Bacillus anthracis]|nr:hypothetical protein COE50_06250 [Bacillus anthracis]